MLKKTFAPIYNYNSTPYSQQGYLFIHFGALLFTLLKCANFSFVLTRPYLAILLATQFRVVFGWGLVTIKLEVDSDWLSILTLYSCRILNNCNYGKLSRKNIGIADRNINAVFLTTVITESYRVKIVLSPIEIVRKVAMLSFVHAPEIEIFQSAKVAILSRNYGSYEYGIKSLIGSQVKNCI